MGMESIYDKKPWLKQYPDWAPHTLDIPSNTALGDFLSSVSKNPKEAAVYYFDHPISYGEIHRLSEGLAFAFSDWGIKRATASSLTSRMSPNFSLPSMLHGSWGLSWCP
jgi:hypothetical protein